MIRYVCDSLQLGRNDQILRVFDSLQLGRNDQILRVFDIISPCNV